jgi:ABC-2 type transport system ATP-binding protein
VAEGAAVAAVVAGPAVPPAAAPAVRVEGLRFAFGAREVLRGVGFEVAAGEMFGLLGPNGGGKTTLFRIITTLAAPTGGRASVFGADLALEPDLVRRRIGVVFQAPSLDKKLGVAENLAHQGHLYGLSGAALTRRSGELLARFSLEGRARDRVETLSGGMKRRLELAKALLHRPRLLVMDEPTTGLDPGARREFWALLDEARRADGTTVLFTTHLMDEADRCDRVAILDAGAVVALDRPEALKAAIGGDVVTVRGAPAPGEAAQGAEDLRAAVARATGLEARFVDGAVRVEAPRGADAVRAISEALGPRVETITLGRPTLEDVFIRRTGKRFEVDA